MYTAMQSGNMVIPDKMQFPTSGAVMPTAGGTACGGISWYADERDSFILWLRGEFAAANAIIDSMCEHLKTVGEPGEYEEFIESVQQRRSNWDPVLHMQQFYSVAEVLNELQQVTWRRQQQQQNHDGGFRQEHGNGHNSNGEFKIPQKLANGSGNLVGIEGHKFDEKNGEVAKYSDGLSTKPRLDNNAKSLDLQSTLSENLDCEAKEKTDSNGSTNAHLENGLSLVHTPQQKPNIAKTFVSTEILDGKPVNVVEGMKMYEEIYDDSGVREMVNLVNDLRTAGRRGRLQGHTFTVSKNPAKGHGREMIQFSIPNVDTPFDDETISATFKDRKIEPIPSLFQDFIERLMSMQVLTVKPDLCIIDIYYEDDHSHPWIWPNWFGRPVCVLSLTECDMTFGRVIESDNRGGYTGSIKLSLNPGSMLVMEGKSADYAKHAIPSINKQRILVTLTKSQPNRATLAPLTSHWALNHTGLKHYVQVSTTGVLPALAVSPNGIQPVFVPAAPWAAVPSPRQHVPPGTGVFLPPGSASSTAEKGNENGGKTWKKENYENCKRV